MLHEPGKTACIWSLRHQSAKRRAVASVDSARSRSSAVVLANGPRMSLEAARQRAG